MVHALIDDPSLPVTALPDAVTDEDFDMLSAALAATVQRQPAVAAALTRSIDRLRQGDGNPSHASDSLVSVLEEARDWDAAVVVPHDLGLPGHRGRLSAHQSRAAAADQRSGRSARDGVVPGPGAAAAARREEPRSLPGEEGEPGRQDHTGSGP
ncbi:hypothetical protein ACFWBX_07015 [Streptomyces sp. NPDC059991]|uniref:hypothetical protein n=1 Tax=Streptomyces sp. NPDC059991 TaxID=3347028 RepID=UPI0036BC6DFE